jgi:hypothetical protein
MKEGSGLAVVEHREDGDRQRLIVGGRVMIAFCRLFRIGRRSTGCLSVMEGQFLFETMEQTKCDSLYGHLQDWLVCF